MEKQRIFKDSIIQYDKDAQNNVINAILAVTELVKSSLGPFGMRKMIIEKYGTVIISNDGLTILKNLDISHPATDSVIQLGKSFVNHVGDGLKTTLIIIGELLKRGLNLIQKNIHPRQIISGYNQALERSIKKLKTITIPIDRDNKDLLKKIATNALNGKFSDKVIEHLSVIAVQAIQNIIVEKSNYIEISIDDNIQFEKVDGGGILDSQIMKGVLISKEILNPKMPKFVKNAKIALINEKLYFEKPTEEDLKVEINILDPESLSEMNFAQNKLLQKKFIAIANSGTNVVITEKGIDKIIISRLVEQGILGIRRAKPEQFKMLSKACGANIIGNVEDLTSEDLGFAETVQEKIVGNKKFVFIEGCKDPKSISILIRGGSWYVCEEVERLLKNAILSVVQVFKNGSQGIVGGGGSIEMEIAYTIKEFAKTIEGKEQLAVKEYGDALEIIPNILAKNFGLDPIDTLAELRYQHSQGEMWKGINSNTLKIDNTINCDIIEPLFNKISVLKYATEFVNSILSIDGILFSKSGLEKIKENP
ncbi:MAG: thermosome subunit [Candidatus Helarchaeota archaeon]|nr:thermosome subunit [Candidatus Helarchaeota archaeon]